MTVLPRAVSYLQEVYMYDNMIDTDTDIVRGFAWKNLGGVNIS